MHICIYCNKQFEYNRSKGHRKNRCGSCMIRLNRKRLKDMALEYMGNCCSVCGYDKCKRALAFHHLIKDDKDFSISQYTALAWPRMKAELDKCILVCSNCHMEIHCQTEQERALARSSMVEHDSDIIKTTDRNRVGRPRINVAS